MLVQILNKSSEKWIWRKRNNIIKNGRTVEVKRKGENPQQNKFMTCIGSNDIHNQLDKHLFLETIPSNDQHDLRARTKGRYRKILELEDDIIHKLNLARNLLEIQADLH